MVLRSCAIACSETSTASEASLATLVPTLVDEPLAFNSPRPESGEGGCSAGRIAPNAKTRALSGVPMSCAIVAS
eukprot:scaffold329919_cov79-Tisochrysis_lutea.AAC.1